MTAVVLIDRRLLAAGLRPVARIAGTDDYRGRATEIAPKTEIAAERRVAAAMPADFAAVDPHRRFVVHRLKIELHPTVTPTLGNGDLAAIPHRLHEIKVLDARQLAFRAEWHANFPAQLAIQQAPGQPGIAGVDFKLPIAIEIEPVFADELRPRILRSWYFCHGLSSFSTCGGDG